MEHVRMMAKPAPSVCPAQRALKLIAGPWKPLILWHLLPGPRRFCQLRDALAPITPKTLTQQLRQMEADGLLKRKLYPQIPPKVEYSLTPKGRSLSPIIQAMCRWASRRCDR